MSFRDVIRFIGRASLSAIFILSGSNKILDYHDTIAAMMAQEVPYTEYLLPAAIVIEILCGLALFFGRFERTASAILALYLIPVTYYFHNFLPIEDHSMRILQFTMFMKNLAIFGGLVTLASESKQTVENQ